MSAHDREARVLVRRAGLDRMLELFPEDVAASAAEAKRLRAGIAAPAGDVEPWPMRRPRQSDEGGA